MTATRISVRLTPRGGRDAIDGWDGDALRARVSAPAAEGRANRALVRLIADKLGIARSSVEIVSGEHARVKQLQIDGLAEDDVQRRLQRDGASGK